MNRPRARCAYTVVAIGAQPEFRAGMATTAFVNTFETRKRVGQYDDLKRVYIRNQAVE